jgi:tetratricopeptide (TPR) repeat protein
MMIMTNNKGLLITLLWCIFMLGCAAGRDSYKTAQDLSEEGRWDEAVVFYESALKEDPENKTYNQALLKAKKELALVYYKRSKDSLATTLDPSLSELNEIIEEADRACSLYPENGDIAIFLYDVTKRKDNLLATITSLYAQADAHWIKGEWIEALQKLQRVYKYYPEYEDAEDKLAKAEEKATQIYYERGVELGNKEDWKSAVHSFKAALDINPHYRDIEQLYKNAQANDNVDYFINKGEEAIRANHWDRAVFLYEKAQEYEPDNKMLSVRVEIMRRKAGEIHFEDAMNFSSQRKLSQATEDLLAALQYSPSLIDSPLYKGFSRSLCQKLDQRSEVYIELKRWGNALVWLDKVESIDPRYEDLFRKTQLVKDKIKQRIRKSIAVFDFSSPRENIEAGKIVASKLVNFLSKNAGSDLKIIERESLQSILKEMHLGQSGLADMDKAQKVGKVRGIDTFILGDVLHFSSKSINYPSKNTVKVQIDTRTEDNPAFERWRILHRYPTEEDLRTAPPMKIEKPVYELCTYETGVTKIISFIEIVYRLVDTRTGETLFTDTIDGKLIEQDAYQHGLSVANIKEDPLELPAEIEVIDALTNKKVSEVGISVLEYFQNLEDVYFSEAERQFKRRNHEEAIERYTDTIFVENLKGKSGQLSLKSSEMIAKIVKNM